MDANHGVLASPQKPTLQKKARECLAKSRSVMMRTRTPRQQHRHRNPFYVTPTVLCLQVRQGAEAGECPEFQRLQAVPIQVPVDASVWGD